MADIDNNQNAENTQLPAEFNDSTDMNGSPEKTCV